MTSPSPRAPGGLSHVLLQYKGPLHCVNRNFYNVGRDGRNLLFAFVSLIMSYLLDN